MSTVYQISTIDETTVKKAGAHFKKHDTKLFELYKKHPLRLSTPMPPRTYFPALVSSIISQQLSTKAADTIEARVHEVLKKVTPDAVLAAEPAALRAAGLSAQKLAYLNALATAWPDIPVSRFKSMPNEDIIAELTRIKGIGQWTVEMFLLSVMARADIFSFGDLILRKQLYALHGLDEGDKTHRTKAEVIAQSWSPYRTVASRLLWAHNNASK